MFVEAAACILLFFAPSPVRAMEPTQFNSALERLNDAGFSSEKTTILKTTISTNTLTCAQAKQVIEAFSFSSDKMEALELIKDHLEDVEHKQVILDAFSSSIDRDKAEQLLANASSAPARDGSSAYQEPLIVVQSGAWEDADVASLVQSISSQNFSSDKKKALKARLRRPFSYRSHSE